MTHAPCMRTGSLPAVNGVELTIRPFQAAGLLAVKEVIKKW